MTAYLRNTITLFNRASFLLQNKYFLIVITIGETQTACHAHKDLYQQKQAQFFTIAMMMLLSRKKCQESSVSTAMPPTFTSDFVGEHNKIESITFGVVIPLCRN